MSLRQLLVLLGGLTLLGFVAIVTSITNTGMAAAETGDMHAAGTAIILLLFVAITVRLISMASP